MRQRPTMPRRGHRAAVRRSVVSRGRPREDDHGGRGRPHGDRHLHGVALEACEGGGEQEARGQGGPPRGPDDDPTGCRDDPRRRRLPAGVRPRPVPDEEQRHADGDQAVDPPGVGDHRDDPGDRERDDRRVGRGPQRGANAVDLSHANRVGLARLGPLWVRPHGLRGHGMPPGGAVAADASLHPRP